MEQPDRNMSIQTKFTRLGCCVIIPTYNNDGTLKKVIDEVRKYTDQVIIVNDGATDKTARILAEYADKACIITHPENVGKGRALRNGFKKALELGYDYAITIDSDGQHFASDLPLFLDELEKDANSLIIGARNMNQENVPGKSSFGNQFSNFWFRVETGITLTDTQSGYRLYPIRKMGQTKYLTTRFEFEVEVIVKAAWAGIHVKNIPIQVHYEAGKARISHFRPFKDFTRISLLNTYLVTLALLYYIPLRFLNLLTLKNLKTFIKKNFFNEAEPPHIKALSIGFGMFMGIFPVWGYQLIIGISMAHLLKLNKAIFILAAHISIPPMIPFIIYGSYKLGAFFVADPQNNLLFTQGFSLEMVKENLFQYVVGAVFLAIAMGLISGIIAYIYFLIVRKKKQY